MKSILITMVILSVGIQGAMAETSCFKGALSDNFGLFQSKNVCTIKNLEHIYSQVKKVESNCNMNHKSYEDYLVESCSFGDESSCGKQRKIAKGSQLKNNDHPIDMSRRDKHQERFLQLMSKMSDIKNLAKDSGRSIASGNDDLIPDCLDAFKDYSNDMMAWQQEHNHIRKRSIRAR